MSKSEKSQIFDNAGIYNCFDRWLDVPYKKFKNMDEMQRELFKKYRKMDFIRTFIVICDLVTQHLNEKDDKKDFIRNIIGSVLGNLTFETCDIDTLRGIIIDLDNERHGELLDWINDRRKGAIWVYGTDINDKIEDIIDKSQGKKSIRGAALDLTYEDYAKYELALCSGASFTDVESLIARGVSRTSLCNMFYNYIFVIRLIEGLMRQNNSQNDQLYLNWYDDNELFIGSSGAIRFFDGVILLDRSDKNDPWLLKCISICHNPLDAIESVDSKLDDIHMDKCILFLPMYPSENAMKYAVYTFAEKRREIITLYLQDLYRMILMNQNKLLDFLKQQRIRE